MTTPVSLTDRLAQLRRDRAEVLVELRPQGVGDDADRATNVDAHIRLAMLDKRIADVEYAMTQSTTTVDDQVVAFGKAITLDFGDGPEDYVVGSAEQAGPDVQVVTPDSALGKVILGVSAGFSTTYQPRPGRTVAVKVLEVA